MSLKIPDPDWYRENFDVVIEVIDLAKQQVLASRTIDYVLGEVCGSSLMYTVEWAESGDTRTRIVQPRLRGMR